MRLFIAANFEEHIKERLREIQQGFEGNLLQARLTKQENFHMTLADLGDVREIQVRKLKKIINAVEGKVFRLVFDNIGWAPKEDGDSWWIGADVNPVMFDLQAQVADRLSEAGFYVLTKQFKPHLTLGRKIILKDRITKEEMRTLLINKAKVEENFPLIANMGKISLMHSERKSTGMVYREVHSQEF